MDNLISRSDAIALAEEVENKRLRGEIDLTYAPMINGIKALPSAQPTQPNTPNTLDALDCISRKDAVDIINGYAEQFNGYIGTPNDSEVYAYARGLLLSIERNINALLSAQSEIVRCEECEHKMECYGDVIMKSRGGGAVYCPLEYCSEGKRKDG